MITRKHYKKIAEIIKDNTNTAYGFISKSVIYSLAEYFEEDNPRFDRDKFIDAIFNLPEIK